MKKLYYLIVLTLILGLVLTGCSLLSNISQVPATEQSGITYLTKALPLTGLVGLWHFDEVVGTAASDSSGNGNDGTLKPIGLEPTWISGKFGNALSFDGSDDYVEVASPNNLYIANAITVQAWIKPSGSGDVVRLQLGYELYVRPDGKLEIALYRSGAWGWWQSISTIPIPATEFYHVAFTYDKDGGADNLKIYINGVLDAQHTVMGALQSSGMFWIGHPYWVFNGIIDEVRIWNTALTAEQLGFYDFIGLLPPYAGPSKAFKRGSSIPLKWKYTDLAGEVVDSSLAIPRVRILTTNNPSPDVTDDVIDVQDPGESGLRYDSNNDMWIFNWQTKEWPETSYEIYITSFQTGQTNGPFEIRLK